jgi:DNA mismatch repair protein MutL
VLLLKELLDNAIDSGATSIDVLVSPNTVDRLEVRDNGHGISPDDFDSLGRPGHTSKLRSFDELDTLGGSTLGFRGTALASVNVLADVSLTTRVPTEHVASVICLAKGGGIASQRLAGAPVGTTVVVTGLFSHLPVRSQAAVKEAPKSLAKMKELLQSYAFTRPCTKLRFTVLKTPNLSWSYAPAASGGVKEAAMQLLGIELTSQCTFETVPSETLQGDSGSSNAQDDPDPPSKQEPRLIFEALLPKPGADPRKISKGAFFSVDSRPVSHARGTAKKLLCIFKKRLGEHFAQDTPRDPFIRLNIRCPAGSYDVNVEPSKDNVIFTEEQGILDQFESFLSFIYSAQERHDSPQQPIAPECCDSPQPPIAAATKVAEAPAAAETLAAEVTSEAPDHRSPPQVWNSPMHTAELC